MVAQGDHAPFALALGIGAAGQRVAEALHARAGWFPRIRRIGLTREEDGRGGYRVISTEAGISRPSSTAWPTAPRSRWWTTPCSPAPRCWP